MSENLSGTYATSGDKVVTFWPAADKDGDGEEVWEDRFDDSGRSLGRHRVKDAQGNPVKNYAVPEGFENRPSFDHSDNYVKLAPNGRDIYRTPNGEAVVIKPGQALVEHSDGRLEVLSDEYSRYVFANAHTKTSDDTRSLAERVPDDETPKE